MTDGLSSTKASWIKTPVDECIKEDDFLPEPSTEPCRCPAGREAPIDISNQCMGVCKPGFFQNGSSINCVKCPDQTRGELILSITDWNAPLHPALPAKYFYQHSTTPATFRNANRDCERKGGHLASVPTEEVNKHLNAICFRAGPSSFNSDCWIGLGPDGNSWTDGSPMTFKPPGFTPATGSGNFHYFIAGATHDGSWGAAAGSPRKNYICELPNEVKDIKGCDSNADLYGQCTYCEGTDCNKLYNGWIAGGTYVGTGRNFGSMESLLIWEKIAAGPNAVLEVDCNIDCSMNDFAHQTTAAPANECRLDFRLFNLSNGRSPPELSFNCSSDGSYHDKRHGELATHSIKLGPYAADWTLVASFVQRAPSFSRAYEAKIQRLALINAINKPSSSPAGAGSCARCPPGTRQNCGSQTEECQICIPCGVGKESDPDDPYKCRPCVGNSFSNDIGGNCHMCGNHTKVNAAKTGCDFTCTFTGGITGKKYDLRQLGSDGGAMAFAGQEYAGYDSPPTEYFLNPCYTSHNQASCTTADNQSLPYMACQTSVEGSYDLGSNIGYTETAPGEVMITLQAGSVCKNHPRQTGARNTTIELRCDASAGRGTPEPYYYRAETYAGCEYKFKWDSVYGCPACAESDFVKVTSDCIDGEKTVQMISRTKKCVGTFEDATGNDDVRSTYREPCIMASVAGQGPPDGKVFLTAATYIDKEREEDEILFPLRVAKALDVSPSSVDVLDIVGIADDESAVNITFRVVVDSKDVDAQIIAMHGLFQNLTSWGSCYAPKDKVSQEFRYGCLLGDIVITRGDPINASNGDLDPGVLTAIVLTVVGLGVMVTFLLYKLKRTNDRMYQVMSKTPGGAGGEYEMNDAFRNDSDGVLYDDAEDEQTAGPF